MSEAKKQDGLVLEKIDTMNCMLINSLIYSIHKIDREHHSYKELETKLPEIKNAEYLMYPNVVTYEAKIFLSKDGEAICQTDLEIDEGILVSLVEV